MNVQLQFDLSYIILDMQTIIIVLLMPKSVIPMTVMFETIVRRGRGADQTLPPTPISYFS